MKYILTLILISLKLISYAQAEDQNFYLNDSKITWSKSYSTKLSKDMIFAFYTKSGLFDKIKIENGVFYATLKPLATDPKKTGVADVPEVVNKTDFKGNVVIQYREKEKEYVITIADLKIIGRGDFLKKNEEQTFEENYLKKGVSEYRPFFLRHVKPVYNNRFSEVFEMK